MPRPDPRPGLVIRYDYLWASEELDGREEGSKIRPCAVVVALPPADDEPRRAIICGITHSKPAGADEGIEIPPAVKDHLGLDGDRSWVVTSEVNLLDWSDPGIVPIAPGQWAYGFLPPALAIAIRDRILARHRASKLPLVDRPRIERRRTKRNKE